MKQLIITCTIVVTISYFTLSLLGFLDAETDPCELASPGDTCVSLSPTPRSIFRQAYYMLGDNLAPVLAAFITIAVGFSVIQSIHASEKLKNDEKPKNDDIFITEDGEFSEDVL